MPMSATSTAPTAPLPRPASRSRAPELAHGESARVAAASGTSTWRAFWCSRLLVWLTGCLAVLLLGTTSAGDSTGISSSFGPVGNVLAAPAVRWDADWYLQIASHGYSTAREAAFFPLYPLVMRAVSLVTGSLAAAGVLVSFAGCFAGLVILRRLAELELGPRVAAAAVELLAFGPVALFLSAVYTEGLFLGLSTGTLYAARRGRWATAGVLGGLSALTRVTGAVLVIPVLLMFFYGPRTDRAPGTQGSGWRPRYRARPAVLWALLIPAAAAAFSGYLALRGFGAAGTVDAQQHFSGHQLVLPFVGLWDGVLAAWHQLGFEVAGVETNTFLEQSLFQLGALVLALAALAATLRRLPIAYGAYALFGLLLVLCAPTAWDPLRGLARYATVLFPLYMGAAAWAVQRGVMRRVVIASAALLCLLTVQFATWHMVGAPAI